MSGLAPARSHALPNFEVLFKAKLLSCAKTFRGVWSLNSERGKLSISHDMTADSIVKSQVDYSQGVTLRIFRAGFWGTAISEPQQS
jgi:hypothetical protein